MDAYLLRALFLKACYSHALSILVPKLYLSSPLALLPRGTSVLSTSSSGCVGSKDPFSAGDDSVEVGASRSSSINRDITAEACSGWLVEMPPDSLSLLPNTTALIDCGDYIVVRCNPTLGTDGTHNDDGDVNDDGNNGHISAATAGSGIHKLGNKVSHRTTGMPRDTASSNSSISLDKEHSNCRLDVATVQVVENKAAAIASSGSRYPVPPVFVLPYAGSPQDRLAYSRLSPVHVDIPDLSKARATALVGLYQALARCNAPPDTPPPPPPPSPPPPPPSSSSISAGSSGTANPAQGQGQGQGQGQTHRQGQQEREQEDNNKQPSQSCNLLTGKGEVTEQVFDSIIRFAPPTDQLFFEKYLQSVTSVASADGIVKAHEEQISRACGRLLYSSLPVRPAHAPVLSPPASQRMDRGIMISGASTPGSNIMRTPAVAPSTSAALQAAGGKSSDGVSSGGLMSWVWGAPTTTAAAIAGEFEGEGQLQPVIGPTATTTVNGMGRELPGLPAGAPQRTSEATNAGRYPPKQNEYHEHHDGARRKILATVFDPSKDSFADTL